MYPFNGHQTLRDQKGLSERRLNLKKGVSPFFHFAKEQQKKTVFLLLMATTIFFSQV